MRTRYAVLLMLASSCATVPQNSTVSDQLLNSVHANAKEPVAFQFSSALPEDHAVAMGELSAESNINATFGDMLEQYAQAKFNHRDPAGTAVQVKLLAFEVTQKQSGNALARLSSYGAQDSAQARIQAVVTVARKGRAPETKAIASSAETTYNTARVNMEQVYSDLANQSSNRAIMAINSYLESLGL